MTGHDVVAALTSRDPTKPIGPVKVLVSGGIGTGKTSLLADIRSALRDAGMTVIARPPRPEDPAGAAVVIDDAHLLGASDLEQLAELVGDPATTVVIAAEPVAHHPALSALSTALARQSPVVTLTALTPAEVHQEIAKIAGAAPPVEVVRAVMTTTAGLPFLVRPAVAALAAPDGEAPVGAAARAARVALIERLRRVDEAVLDTLLVSSLSPELGPDDVAAALRTDGGQAHTLVDRARASGLIAPSHSHTFLGSLHESLAQIIGATRHYDIEVALVRTQIEKSTLSMDLALKLADHGLRNPQLADALTDLAARNRAHPGQAARLYRAATEVGATALNARLADALALTGDCGTAGRLADELLASDDPEERAAAVRIAASVAAHDGGATQAAELFRWLGPYSDAVVSAAGAVVTIGVGDAASARAWIASESGGPPTSTARAARSLVEGLVQTLDSPYPVAIARLAQSIT
ncbi:MAG TPA: LuxR family transcriptional regulator, partial [Mycobacterium sp.]